MTWKALLETNWATGGRKLFVYGREPGLGREWLMSTVIKFDGSFPEPVAFIAETREQIQDGLSPLQAIFDALCDAGFKPKDYNENDHTNELKAVRYHLQDMRTLVFKGKNP